MNNNNSNNSNNNSNNDNNDNNKSVTVNFNLFLPLSFLFSFFLFCGTSMNRR